MFKRLLSAPSVILLGGLLGLAITDLKAHYVVHYPTRCVASYPEGAIGCDIAGPYSYCETACDGTWCVNE